MMMKIDTIALSKYTLLLGLALAFAAGTPAAADVIIEERGADLCIKSDGLPDHPTGRFPNPGNPNAIRPQNISVCVPMNPRKRASPTEVRRGAVGIGLNGIIFRPEAADYWDPNSPRGFSRRDSGWRIEPMGAKSLLGLDRQNAHVDRRGLYHYHGKSSGLLAAASGSQIGYAADGFEIHYVGGRVKPGWSLKQGTRPSGPGGRYDGTYVQDYEYVGGSGRLDRCNGGTLNGEYVYFLTDTYPFYPRCLWGRSGRGFR